MVYARKSGTGTPSGSTTRRSIQRRGDALVFMSGNRTTTSAAGAWVSTVVWTSTVIETCPRGARSLNVPSSSVVDLVRSFLEDVPYAPSTEQSGTGLPCASSTRPLISTLSGRRRTTSLVSVAGTFHEKWTPSSVWTSREKSSLGTLSNANAPSASVTAGLSERTLGSSRAHHRRAAKTGSPLASRI